MIKGETVSSGAEIPKDGTFGILSSPAGYYLGWSDKEGPYTRETFYMDSYEIASLVLWDCWKVAGAPGERT